jgi:flagellar basal-body rod protein FlgF
LQTGRSLDIAVEGDGWIAVQNRDGREAYTRAGNLKITENGLLQTASGLIVQGENGPISIPADTSIVIDKDGAVSYAVPGGSIQTQTVIDRLKLVKFDNKDLARGDDGLFYASIQAEPVQSDPNLKVLSGFLEASNVNPVDAMVRMLSLSKQFDLQMEMLKNAQTNGAKSSQIMSLT